MSLNSVAINSLPLFGKDEKRSMYIKKNTIAGTIKDISLK
jgi:hypothetical protein